MNPTGSQHSQHSDIQKLVQRLESVETALSSLAEAMTCLSSIAQDIHRIADTLDPPPPDKVDSAFVAARLGCTTTWIAELVRQGEIPKNAIVTGTGHGKPWKFYRSVIEKWIENR